MIEEVEELMQHWGNQFNQVGDGGGLAARWRRSWSGAALPLAVRRDRAT